MIAATNKNSAARDREYRPENHLVARDRYLLPMITSTSPFRFARSLRQCCLENKSRCPTYKSRAQFRDSLPLVFPFASAASFIDYHTVISLAICNECQPRRCSVHLGRAIPVNYDPEVTRAVGVESCINLCREAIGNLHQLQRVPEFHECIRQFVLQVVELTPVCTSQPTRPTRPFWVLISATPFSSYP